MNFKKAALFLLLLNTINALAQTTTSSQISASMDDIEEWYDGTIYTNSTDLELIHDAKVTRLDQTIGLRFNNIAVPQGAMILDAYIQFTADEIKTGTTNLTIKGEATDNAIPFDTIDYNVSSRTTTTASVNWIPSDWNIVGDAGFRQRTPNLAPIVNEVVSSAGFVQGNSMAMIISGSGVRIAESYDGVPALAPKLIITYCLAGQACNPTASLFINEVMADNETALADNFGEYDDWIEIYNPTNTAVNLADYYMTDDPTDPTKWRIPNTNSALTTIPANGFLLLWADKDSEQGENHLDFKISSDETIALVAPNGTQVIATLTIPHLANDESYGSRLDGSSIYKKFIQSVSPAATNNNALDVEIFFSKESQLFVNSINVQLSSNNTNGVIRYTTDGSEPTMTSSQYSSTLPITSNTTLKAKFFFTNGNQSNTQAARYVKMQSNLAAANSNLPMITINTYEQVLDKDNMQNTFWSVIEPNNNGRTYGGDAPSFAGKVGMRIRGASSSSFPKKQWRCELRNEDDTDLDMQLLGMSEDSDWVLYAPGRYDRALINNALMYEISNQLGYYAPRTRFVEVYYNEDNTLDEGDYWGIYILMEKIKVHKDRVDIAQLKPTDNTGEELTGGYLFSLNRSAHISTSYTQGVSVSGYELNDPDNDAITSTQYNYIEDEILKFESALTSNNWLHPTLGYKNFTDINTWVGPHILKALGKEPDGFHLSFYLQKDKNGLINAGPIWDFDRAINSAGDSRSQNYWGWDTKWVGNDNPGNVNYWKGSGNERGGFVKNIVEDPIYRTLFYDKWFDWRKNNILKTTEINALIDSMANELAEAQARNQNRWGSVSGYAPRGNFFTEIDMLKDWLKDRSEWMDGELMRPPVFNPNGGVVSLGQSINISNPNGGGTIYYTLDGTDPRLEDGQISPVAIAFNSNIGIPNIGINYISARVKDGNEWGAICTQQFYVPISYSGLAINEIHYNPNDSIFFNNAINALDTIGGKNFEFIEIKNAGTTTVSLTGIKFINGISLEIQNTIILAPNDFAVFAEDAYWFTQKYGFAPDGEYKDQLSNSGERLELQNPFGGIIDTLKYNDKLPWDVIPDQGLYSLALKDANADNSLAANWSAQDVYVTPRAENTFQEFVNAKILLEGFYESATGQMHTKLKDNNLLSLTQPYNTTPWNYTGTESVLAIPSNAVDWILIMARDAAGNTLEQNVGFINQSGELMATDGTLGIPIAAVGNRISIHHRSHLAVISATPYMGAFYDFTTAANQAQGTQQLKLKSGKYMLYAGDFDGNGLINSSDFNDWKIQSAVLNQYLPIDGDGNGIINVADYNLWINNRSKVGEQVIRY